MDKSFIKTLALKYFYFMYVGTIALTSFSQIFSNYHGIISPAYEIIIMIPIISLLYAFPAFIICIVTLLITNGFYKVIQKIFGVQCTTLELFLLIIKGLKFSIGIFWFLTFIIVTMCFKMLYNIGKGINGEYEKIFFLCFNVLGVQSIGLCAKTHKVCGYERYGKSWKGCD